MSKQSNKVKVITRPVFETLVAATLRIPYFSDEDGDTTYHLNYITTGGKAKAVACSKGVYKDVESEQLYKNYRVQFHLLFNEEEQLVTHINLKSKKEFLPAGFTEENIVGHTNTDVQHVEVSLSPDSELKILRTPTSTASSTENDILKSLQEDTAVSSGDYLQGKYRVVEIRERDGFKTFFVDPSVE
jgi:hypothetical protein